MLKIANTKNKKSELPKMLGKSLNKYKEERKLKT